MDDLFDRELDEEKRKRKENQDYLKEKIVNFERLTTDTTWEEIEKYFQNDQTFKKMLDLDKIRVFGDIISDLET